MYTFLRIRFESIVVSYNHVIEVKTAALTKNRREWHTVRCIYNRNCSVMRSRL